MRLISPCTMNTTPWNAGLSQRRPSLAEQGKRVAGYLHAPAMCHKQIGLPWLPQPIFEFCTHILHSGLLYLTFQYPGKWSIG